MSLNTGVIETESEGAGSDDKLIDMNDLPGTHAIDYAIVLTLLQYISFLPC